MIGEITSSRCSKRSRDRCWPCWGFQGFHPQWRSSCRHSCARARAKDSQGENRRGIFLRSQTLENGDLLNGSKVILDRFTILITVYYFILEDSTVKSWYKLKRVYLFWEIIGFNSHFLKVLVIFELNSKFPFCSPLEASSYIHIISIERVLPLSRSLSIYIVI